MQDAKHRHPIRRIRDQFKFTSVASGLREFRTSAGFAKLIGRAPSSIRNVEGGHTKKWDRLARHIASITGVSADWMLSDPNPSDPIIGVDGTPWEPEDKLDYLGGGGGNINWRTLIAVSPKGAATFAGRIVEMKLSDDLVRGEKMKDNPSTLFLSDLARLFEKHDCLGNQTVVNRFLESIISDTQQILADLVRTVASSRKTS